MHDKEGDHCCKSRNLFLFFCHADSHTYSKDQRQVIKDYASGFAHYREKTLRTVPSPKIA